MNEHQELAIKALNAAKGDDFSRAKHAFREFTADQMNEFHGESGLTRAQVLDGYTIHDEKINKAIEWIQSI